MAPPAQIHTSTLSLPPDSYIYKLLPTSARTSPLSYSTLDELAVICSDDSLRFLTPSLTLASSGLIKNVHESVTCLERVDDRGTIVATAGRDSTVRFWDRRTRSRVSEIRTPKEGPISALVCDQGRNLVAAGIENPNDGLGDTPVYIWDTRNPSTPTLQFTESHTDTITSLQLHPSLPTLLLSASTDNLISIFDTSKPDEEEALYQVINHGSAIHHAGFMYPSTDVYALGTDETIAFYALQSEDEQREEPKPRVLGDVREELDVEYLVDVAWVGDKPVLVGGKHSASRFDMIPISKTDESPLHYSFDTSKRLQFPGAHGEEIIRDVFTDVHTHITYTCGEDGFVRAWKSTEADGDGDAMETSEPEKGKREKSKKKDKKEKRKKDGGEEAGAKRFKPY